MCPPRRVSPFSFPRRPLFHRTAMSNPTLAHDLALKRTVHTPLDQKPHYAWRDVLAAETISIPSVVLLCPHGEERFDIAEVADTLDKALTNVCLARVCD